MRKHILYFCLILVCTAGNRLYSCTVFVATDSTHTLVGSNEDWKPADSQVFFIPGEKGMYGHALLGYNGSVQAGFNEKGLFWDGLRAYPKIRVNNSTGKPDIRGWVLHKILEECATVDDVVNLFETYYWDGFSLSQIMVADSSGASAIITMDKAGLTVTRKRNWYQVCTNFRITEPRHADGAHWFDIGGRRYVKAGNMLQAGPVSQEHFLSILADTAQKNFFSRTIYSTVCNLNTGEMHISINGDFSRIAAVSLHEELKQGRHSYYLSDLVGTVPGNRDNIKVTDDDFLTGKQSVILLDKDWNPVDTEQKAAYYRTIEKDSLSNSYIMLDYFLTDTLQGRSYYMSLNPRIIDGPYYEYYPNGKTRVQGLFRRRLRHGEWTFFSRKGETDSTVRYAGGVKRENSSIQ